ncbi:MAG TPA: error-prone DNA polymerase [Solibacterales bacterium]|nr:error-prone DNA polymerase [Bryobacterales bacterium]
MGYVELHARSAFSFLEGSSQPEDLANQAAAFGYPAIAQLDRDSLSGAPRFYQAAKKLGIKAHIGAEVTSVDGCRYVLLAESRAGYQNLCRLITSMKLRCPKGEAAATHDEFARYAEGLVCLTGGPEGPLAHALTYGWEAAGQMLDHLVRLYGRRNVFIELQRHHDRREEARNQAAVALARRQGLPLLAANGVSHLDARQRELLDVLTCVREKVALEDAGRRLAVNSERYLKTAQAMERLFADLPEAVGNAGELSARLDFTLADLGYQFPQYPVPAGETMNSFLAKRTQEGARRRYRPYHDRARRQIDRELALIEKLDLAGYFLIVWDIVEFCRCEGILAQGRGSAANSAVCYSLGITAVDPVGMELLFERFLSEERGEWPDIDLDLPSGDQRERVIQYVYQRYGKLGAAMTANVITYRGRSAARDVGKVFGFDDAALARLSQLTRGWEWKDTTDTDERRFREAGFDLKQPLVAKFFEIFRGIQDLPRHLGQHSGGMVVCQGQLDSIVPLEPATMPGRVVIQWDKEDCNDLGIIKVDLLGLGMMAVLEDCVTLVRDAYREEIDLAHLPPDDPAVYAALQSADTVGLFQVESRAQMSCLPRLKPKCFYDIVVEVAIIRPGPIVGKLLHPYLRRRQGREPVDYMHPSLEPVLRRTLGVPLFQEQLLKMAMIVAGFTGGQAEELRRAFGFKRSEKRMTEVEQKLRAGMEANSIDAAAQDRIIQSITSFALYGFPESHAASFALIAYASAWLKEHYLAAFTAAMLNNQPMGFYQPATLVKDAQRHGLRFRPVDVQVSHWKCTIENGEGGERVVRLGFNYVRGFRQEAALALVAERGRGLFASIDDFTRRVTELRKDEVTRLAQVGALNSLTAHRRSALWESEAALRAPGPLWEGMAAEDSNPLRTMTEVERLHADFRGTGLTIGKHPMAWLRPRLDERKVRRAAELHTLRNGMVVRVAGCVICRQRPGTAKGFLFMSLEDETGIANAIIEPAFYEAHRTVLVSEQFLLLEGSLQHVDGVVSVKVARAEAIRAPQPAAPSHDFH